MHSPDDMSLESDGGMILTGENRRTRRKTCPSATLSTTKPKWVDLGGNPGLRGKGRRLTTWAMAQSWSRACIVLGQWMRKVVYLKLQTGPDGDIRYAENLWKRITLCATKIRCLKSRKFETIVYRWRYNSNHTIISLYLPICGFSRCSTNYIYGMYARHVTHPEESCCVSVCLIKKPRKGGRQNVHPGL
jgi:hypothetical protein